MSDPLSNPVKTAPANTSPIPVCNLLSTEGNPYQAMMYSALSDRYTYVPTRKLAHVISVQENTDGPVLLHLHWEDRMFAKTTDQVANRAALDHYMNVIADCRDKGTKVLWTVHNKTPHANRDPETFRLARERFISIADRIHVHSVHARDHMVTEYGVDPEQCRVIAHPSYLGIYEDAQTTLARTLPPGPTHFLQFGMMRGQKGLDQLGTAAHMLRAKRPVGWHMTVAGRTPGNMRKPMRRLNQLPMVTSMANYIPSEQIPEIFGSAHIFMAPFSDVFSSGSIALALTFGLPVIGPNVPGLREILSPNMRSLLYPPGDTRLLMRRMAQARDVSDEIRQGWRDAAFAYAFENRPEIASLALGRVLDEICDEM